MCDCVSRTFNRFIKAFDQLSISIYSKKESSLMEIQANRSLERFEILDQILSLFPKKVKLIIKKYDQDKSFESLYKKVMKVLLPTKTEQEYLNFHDNHFPTWILKILMKRGHKMIFNDLFWYDLGRILFKWTIHTEQRLSNKDKKFELILKDVYSINNIIHKETFQDFPSDLNVSFMNYSTLFKFTRLMNCEFVENASFLFPLFAFLVRDYYVNGIEWRYLRRKYFQRMDYSDNILLKFMILIHDPSGLLRQELFSIDEYSPFSELSDSIPSSSINDEFLYRLRVNGPESIGNIDLAHINTCMIDFFLSTNQKIQILAFDDILNLLARLKKLKLANFETLEEITGIEIVKEKFD